MKKILSLVLALSLVLSLGLVANAAGRVTEDLKVTLTDNKTVANNGSGTGSEATVSVGDDMTTVLGAGSLIPGKEYKFLIASAGTGTDNLDGAQKIYNAVAGGNGNTKTHDFKIEWSEGKDLFEKFEIVKGVDEYYLVIKAKDNYATKENKFSVKVTLRAKNSNNDTSYSLAIKEGTVQYVASDVSSYQDVDTTPIIRMKDKSSYDDAEFVAGNYAKFVVNVDGNQADRYMGFTSKAIQEVIDANPSIDMNFVSFPAKPSFNRLGKLYIYADKDQILYEVKDGKLVALKADYDESEEAFVVSTRSLGAYVVADKELKNVTVPTSSTTSNGSNNTSSTTSNGSTTNNPQTGSHDVVGLAAVAALVSLAAVGAVAFKKSAKK